MSKRKIKILVCVGCFTLGTFVGNSIANFFQELEEEKSRQSTFPNLKNCLHAIKNSVVKTLGNSNSKIFVIREHGDFVSTWSEFEADIKEVAVIGFDCEWTTRRESRGRVALMQLATYSGLTLLIQLNKLTALPTSLLNCLSDANIVKVGVGCIEDAKKLLDDRSIVVNGCFDLRFLVDHHSLSPDQNLGLKALCSKYLNVHLSKPRHIQCSNWDVNTLNSHQIEYAAKDATVAIQIFVSAMMDRFLSRPNHIVKLIDDSLRKEVWNEMFSECLKFRDLKFKDLRRTRVNRCRSAARPMNSIKATKSYKSRKTPMYDNCMLQAPDGGDLTTCNRKKADWYVQRGLGAVINEDPYVVRLNFVPAGRPDSQDNYYLQEKENQCVVCGSKDKIVRKNVVPHEYRKYFPVELKSHHSHDVLPLCVQCHRKSTVHDDQLRHQISREFDTPLTSETDSHYFEDPEKKSVRSAGHALAKMGDCIPQERKRQLEGSILRYFNESTLDDALIEKALKLDIKVKNASFVPHAELVVRKLMRKKNPYKNLCEFEKAWRKHFVNTMSPKHLPNKWSIDYKRPKEPPKKSLNSKISFDLLMKEELEESNDGCTTTTTRSQSCHISSHVFNGLEQALNKFTGDMTANVTDQAVVQPKSFAPKLDLMTENVSSSELSGINDYHGWKNTRGKRKNRHGFNSKSSTAKELNKFKSTGNAIRMESQGDEDKAASSLKLIANASDLDLKCDDDGEPSLNLYINNNEHPSLAETVECNRPMTDCENAGNFNARKKHSKETASGETPLTEDKTGDNNWSVKVDKSEGDSFREQDIGDRNFNVLNSNQAVFDLLPNDSEPQTDASAVYSDDVFSFHSVNKPRIHEIDDEPADEFDQLLADTEKVEEVDSRSDESMLCVDTTDAPASKSDRYDSIYSEATDVEHRNISVHEIVSNKIEATRSKLEAENIFAMTDTDASASNDQSVDELPPDQVESGAHPRLDADTSRASCLLDSGENTLEESPSSATAIADFFSGGWMLNSSDQQELDFVSSNTSTVDLLGVCNDVKSYCIGSEVDDVAYYNKQSEAWHGVRERVATTDEQGGSSTLSESEEVVSNVEEANKSSNNVEEEEETASGALEEKSTTALESDPQGDDVTEKEEDITAAVARLQIEPQDAAKQPNPFEAIPQQQGDQSELDKSKTGEQKSPVQNPTDNVLGSCVDSHIYLSAATPAVEPTAATPSHVGREVKVKANKSESRIKKTSNVDKVCKKSGPRHIRSTRNSSSSRSSNKLTTSVSLSESDALRARFEATLMGSCQRRRVAAFASLSKIKLGSKGSIRGKLCNTSSSNLRLPRRSVSRRVSAREINFRYAVEKYNLRLEAAKKSKLASETATEAAELSVTTAVLGTSSGSNLYHYVSNIFKASSVNVAKHQGETGSHREELSDHSSGDKEPCLPYSAASADENSSGRASVNTKASLALSGYTEVSLSCPGSSLEDTDNYETNYDCF